MTVKNSVLLSTELDGILPKPGWKIKLFYYCSLQILNIVFAI